MRWLHASACSLALLVCGCTSAADSEADAGLAHARAGAYVEAGRAFEKALRHDAQQLKALYNLAALRHVEGRHAEATTLFERFLLLRPDDAQGHFELARTRAALGLTAEALASLQRAVELGFDDHAALTSADFDALRGEVPYVMLEVTVAQRNGVASERTAANPANPPASTPPPRIRPPRSADPACESNTATLTPTLASD